MKNASPLAAVIAAVFLVITGCGKTSSLDIREDNLAAHMSYQVETVGVRPAGSAEEKVCGDYIYGQFLAYGYNQSGFSLNRVPFSVEKPRSLRSENIIAVKEAENSKGILAVIAHYDSVPTTPGARDNAGGVSALLELSRLLKDIDSPYEIRFIALGAEEIGYQGALAYVEGLSEQEKNRHLAVYNMDITLSTAGSDAVMVVNTLGGRRQGVYQEGDFLEPAQNLVSGSIAAAYGKLGYEKGRLVAPVHYGESDHLPFHDAGIDAGNVCWRLWEDGQVKLPAEYHLPEDDLSRLDYQSLYATVSCIATAILDME